MPGKRVLCASISLMMILACTQKPAGPEDPKRRLSDYITRSFAVRDVGGKKDLLDYLIGDARERLSAWSDEQFRQAFIDSKRQFLKLNIQEVKPTSPTEVSITYELTFLDQNRGHDAKVANKKLCRMILDQGNWYITEVQNIKELVEYRNEMSVP